jgi:hypothetical protein
MRTWTVAQKHERCGGCWREIAPDQPMQIIELEGLSSLSPLKRRLRCQRCASGPVDWDAIQAARAQGDPFAERDAQGFTKVSDAGLGSVFDDHPLLKE